MSYLGKQLGKGIQGEDGPIGPQGIQGIQGIKGDDGAVMSVAGRSGDVVLSTTDISGLDTALATKQASLVSGTNIKTINGTSVLGSGNITTPTTTINNTLTSTSTTEALSANMGKSLQDGKQATLVSGTNIKTINGTSVLGSGDIAISKDIDVLFNYNFVNIRLHDNVLPSGYKRIKVLVKYDASSSGSPELKINGITSRYTGMTAHCGYTSGGNQYSNVSAMYLKNTTLNNDGKYLEIDIELCAGQYYNRIEAKSILHGITREINFSHFQIDTTTTPITEINRINLDLGVEGYGSILILGSKNV